MKCRMLFGAVLFGVFAFGGANPGTSQKKDEPPKKAAEGDDFAKLRKARVAAAEKAYKAYIKEVANERPFSITAYHLSVAWLNAELELASEKLERIAARNAHLQRIRHWKKVFEDDSDVLPGSTVILVIESFEREAEIRSAEEGLGKK